MFHSRVPPTIRKQAANMIIDMLQTNPDKRPTIHKLLEYEYITNCYLPQSLPTACLTMAPRSDQIEDGSRRRPLSEMNNQLDNTRAESTFLKNNLYDCITASGSVVPHNSAMYKIDIESLYKQLTDLIESKPPRIEGMLTDEVTDPSSQPLFWISKWVDYSDKYGFGYQLCDEGMGVMFNDTTKLIMLTNGQ